MNTVTLGDATNIIIYIWNKFLNLLFNQMSFDGGATVGWVIIGVGLIGMLLATILSRPFSGTVNWTYKEDKKEEK